MDTNMRESRRGGAQKSPMGNIGLRGKETGYLAGSNFTSSKTQSLPWRDIWPVRAAPTLAAASVGASTLNCIVIARMKPGISSCFTRSADLSASRATTTPRRA